jgi:hypothetical protein
MIISLLIILFGAAAMWEFSFAFCRSLLMTYSKVELSDRVRELIGVNDGAPKSCEFNRVMMMARLAPDPGDDRMEIKAVGLYFRLMKLGRWLASPLSTRLSRWFESELSRCCYFAAVTLDRRLVASLQ